MPTGLAMPVGIGSGGGARLVTGDENDDKIIRLALSDDDNENAFQQSIGVGTAMVFDISDELLQATIMRRINEAFRKFEAQNRYKLQRSTIEWSSGNDQELVLSFKYVNLESDKEQDFRQNFSAASASNFG